MDRVAPLVFWSHIMNMKWKPWKLRIFLDEEPEVKAKPKPKNGRRRGRGIKPKPVPENKK